MLYLLFGLALTFVLFFATEQIMVPVAILLFFALSVGIIMVSRKEEEKKED